MASLQNMVEEILGIQEKILTPEGKKPEVADALDARFNELQAQLDPLVEPGPPFQTITVNGIDYELKKLDHYVNIEPVTGVS